MKRMIIYEDSLPKQQPKKKKKPTEFKVYRGIINRCAQVQEISGINKEAQIYTAEDALWQSLVDTTDFMTLYGQIMLKYSNKWLCTVAP